MKDWGDLKMKSFLNNSGYFLKEVRTIIRLDLMSNIFSLFSTTLIFFILTMVMSGWWISNQVVEAVQGEAEINAYFDENIGNDGVTALVEKIETIDGVQEARLVNEDEAYDRMAEILGEDARVLEFFEDNPFSPFIEVKIHLEEINSVLTHLDTMADIAYVRDNREILDRLKNIAGTLKFLGFVVVGAVGISTLVIISHIIRQGIYSNREQINTLRLLGAPELFIAFPFLLEGLFLTVGGGIFAAVLAIFSIKYIYAQLAGPLPFIPLPSRDALIFNLVILITGLSACMGIVGSLLGLSSAKNN
ncbi:cell division transport system permease protein [Anaerosolibacter carboniphilus]|uniref:Cell division protein FtsX n=1 Tax=Anaerosolibacter carboniphilus TaxID=1417629 RepID=A0A841L167_9FIRM|nr:cell division transport system permease protein [Anaerosolibacter carboniphilus]